jgi:hypothetical protein
MMSRLRRLHLYACLIASAQKVNFNRGILGSLWHQKFPSESWLLESK